MLLVGPPGSGKTMLARRLPSILPPLSFDEALEATKLYSIAARGPAPAAVRCAAKTRLPRLPAGQALLTRRPFRAPHHSISDAGLIGGGSRGTTVVSPALARPASPIMVSSSSTSCPSSTATGWRHCANRRRMGWSS